MIIENKVEKIILLLAIIFSVTTVTALLNTSYEAESYGYNEFDNITYDEFNQTIQDDSEDIINAITGVFSALAWQISGAPVVINGIMGFLSFIAWLSLSLIIVSFARELIGLT